MKHYVLKSAFISVCLVLISGMVAAQEDAPILVVDADTIYTSEFEYVFNKNRDNPYVEEKTPQEYMDLFVQFKLKVHEAERLGLDTLPKFVKELGGYRDQLARPYLIDSEVTEQLIEEVFDRYKTEIEASHILFQVSPSAAPKDTAMVYQRAVEVREKLLAGAAFDSLARKYSQDPSAKDNGGRIGYFSALYLVYPFENAAYNLEVGEISMPVRTRYGYHLIRVTDRRPARGEVKVAHIMIRLEDSSTEADKEVAYEKIKSISEEIKAGADFAEMARVYSDDKTTATSGGELRWFGSNVMVEPFDSAAFSLSEIGSISEPVLTQFGWHLIKLIDRKGPPTRETSEDDVRRKIQRDSRSELSTLAVMNRLKKEYSYKREERAWELFLDQVDERLINATWEAPIFKKDRTLFTLDGIAHKQSEFAEFLAGQQTTKSKIESVDSWTSERYDQWVNAIITAYENSRLEDKYQDFRMLFKEYREGILLFDLMEKEVWKKAVSDTIGLEAYHQEHLADFMWEDRYTVGVYSLANMKDALKFRKKLAKGNDATELVASFNDADALRVQEKSGTFEYSELEWLEKVDASVGEGIMEPFEWKGRYLVVHLKEVEGARPKTIKEARGQITAAYQEYLEGVLIERLRAETPVHVFEDVLNKVE